jgi:cysteinyl-tRNA synthetase
MSKSTKHFYLAENLCREFDPEAIRFYLLSTHYRSPIEFGKERLEEAGAALGRLRNSIRLALSAEAKLPDSERSGQVRDSELESARTNAIRCFDEAMDDDFNTARAIACLFDLSKRVNLAMEGDQAGPATVSTAASAAREIMSLGGVLGLTWEGVEEREEIPAEIAAMVAQREEARGNKDWSKADELRDAIAQRGFVLEDRADGTQVRRKD